jgi:hypothetical protein
MSIRFHFNGEIWNKSILWPSNNQFFQWIPFVIGTYRTAKTDKIPYVFFRWKNWLGPQRKEASVTQIMRQIIANICIKPYFISILRISKITSLETCLFYYRCIGWY